MAKETNDVTDEENSCTGNQFFCVTCLLLKAWKFLQHRYRVVTM